MSESETNSKNPFVGPEPLKNGDKFYGRETEQSELFQLLDAHRIVLLHAPSGAGKTSLIQAGLIPRLEDDNFQVFPIAHLNQLPTDNALIDKGFNRYVYSFIFSLEGKELLTSGDQSTESLAKLKVDSYLKSRVDSLKTWDPVVLIIDQFEEVLKDPIDIPEKVAFFAQLGKALHSQNFWALFVIRDDYMGALMDWKYIRHIPTRLANTYRLDLLDQYAAGRVIKLTADYGSREFADEAVTKLVDNLRRIKVQQPDGTLQEEYGSFVEPVQLQVVCKRLWNHLPSAKTVITESDLEDYGDVDQSLADYYADEVNNIAVKMQVDERTIRRWVQDRLITSRGIRLPVLKEEEETRGLDNKVVEELVSAHLLRREPRAGRFFFELSHDRLVQPVLDNNRQWFNENLSLLQRRAQLWESENYPEYLLLRGDHLLKEKEWADENKDLLSSLDNDFLEASTKKQKDDEEKRKARERELELAQELAEEERKKKRSYMWVAILFFVLLTVVIIAGYGIIKYQREIADTQRASAKIVAEANSSKATSIADERTKVYEAEATKSAANATAESVNANATIDALEAGVSIFSAQVTADFAQVTAAAGQSTVDPATATSNAATAESVVANATSTARVAEMAIAAANATATHASEAANATATAVQSEAFAIFPAGVGILIISQPGSNDQIDRIEGERLRVLGAQEGWVEAEELPGGKFRIIRDNVEQVWYIRIDAPAGYTGADLPGNPINIQSTQTYYKWDVWFE